MAPNADSDKYTYDDLVDEISSFVEANRDLSDFEFQCLLEEAFNIQKPNIESDVTDDGKPRKNVRKIWFLIKLIFIFMAVVAGLGLLSYATDHVVTRSVYQIAANHFDLPPFLDLKYYLLLRPVRMLAVYFNLPKLQALPECHFPNPFLPGEEIPEHTADVCQCRNVQHILTANTSVQDGRLNINPDFITNHPILLKKWSKKVKVSTLRDRLKKSGSLLYEVPNVVNSNHEEISSMKDLANMENFDKFLKDKNLQVEWLASHYVGLTAIKDLFPLPQFVLDVYLDTNRILLIDGPLADAHVVPQPKQTFTSAYIQGSGSRKIILTPKYPCENRCHFLSANVEAGDILLFSMSSYDARSEKVDSVVSLSSVVSLEDIESGYPN